MKYPEFLAKVRERGEYGSQEETERVIRTVLAVLGTRLAGGESHDLAAQLPQQVADVLRVQSAEGSAMSLDQFLGKIATRLGSASIETARWDASAVLSTMAESIAGGELNQVLSQLPSSFSSLFGHPELA
ncbi:DUF2267 domain-containing protein [Haloactinomyces albus]|uniref:Uncharacterized protein (DUF2267 family) n=1 Tax=Haloactinomyces albus TaxID=1352928 RepID=A0AAE3ZD27_9ACTN|nr:DUF2267 domain-containing protein [Haloactinomyces albus]MDR7301433.1 uncharacterized protein (DUF2267 family) [Haloactinomyces albus]